jgi:hypothetical protein
VSKYSPTNGSEYIIRIVYFVKILGITNKISNPSLVSRHTSIQIYKTLARAMLSYGSKSWTVRKILVHARK